VFRLLVLLMLVGVLTFSGACAAEARIFEPQANWWSSGRNCAATRGPPGRRWRALPPRSCLTPEAIDMDVSDVGRPGIDILDMIRASPPDLGSGVELDCIGDPKADGPTQPVKPISKVMGRGGCRDS
jgi:hypothetical protein